MYGYSLFIRPFFFFDTGVCLQLVKIGTQVFTNPGLVIIVHVYILALGVSIFLRFSIDFGASTWAMALAFSTSVR